MVKWRCPTNLEFPQPDSIREDHFVSFATIPIGFPFPTPRCKFSRRAPDELHLQAVVVADLTRFLANHRIGGRRRGFVSLVRIGLRHARKGNDSDYAEVNATGIHGGNPEFWDVHVR